MGAIEEAAHRLRDRQKARIGNPPAPQEVDDLATLIDAACAPRGHGVEIYEFKAKGGVHVQHPAIERGSTYNGMCLGRVFRLACPFGWQHFYCDRACCDQTGKRDEETGEELGRHHVKCVTDFTYVNLYYCIDCSRFGTLTAEPKSDKQPQVA